MSSTCQLAAQLFESNSCFLLFQIVLVEDCGGDASWEMIKDQRWAMPEFAASN